METSEDKQIKDFMEKHGIKTMKTHDGIDFSSKLPEVKPKKKTISEQIADLQQQLLEVKGRETEKYARIVGYYRAVKNWNIGKQAEWKERVNYDEKSFDGKDKAVAKKAVKKQSKNKKIKTGDFHHYKLFYRPTCPNCPAVKTIMRITAFEGTLINAEEEIDLAVELNVFAVPTVVFFDRQDKELARASQIPDLRRILEKFKVK